MNKGVDVVDDDGTLLGVPFLFGAELGTDTFNFVIESTTESNASSLFSNIVAREPVLVPDVLVVEPPLAGVFRSCAIFSRFE